MQEDPDSESVFARRSTAIAATGLAAISGLHVLWATGSRWPIGESAEFADAVVGRPEAKTPGPAACLAVAGLLGTASALVAGRPHRAPAVSRTGSAGVVGVLALRGLLGVAGRTDVVSPGSSSERFRRMDRRIYGPLCLGLATLAAPAVTRRQAGGGVVRPPLWGCVTSAA